MSRLTIKKKSADFKPDKKSAKIGQISTVIDRQIMETIVLEVLAVSATTYEILTNSCAHLVGEGVKHLEVIAGLHATSTTHNNLNTRIL